MRNPATPTRTNGRFRRTNGYAVVITFVTGIASGTAKATARQANRLAATAFDDESMGGKRRHRDHRVWNAERKGRYDIEKRMDDPRGQHRCTDEFQ